MHAAYLTTGQIAHRLNAPEWLIRRLVDRLEPRPTRLGPHRQIPQSRIPELEALLLRHRPRIIKREVAHAQ